MYAARFSLVTALLGSLLTVTVGGLVGLVAGVMGGFWDRLLMRVAELVMALPAIYLILAFRNLFPDALSATVSATIVVATLAFVAWSGIARLVRSQVLTLREHEFVSAALAAGARRRWLILRHLLPNLVPFLLLQLGITFPYFLLGEATLSFLGLGLPDPWPSWGNMLSTATAAAGAYWWLWAAPAAALTLSVLGANLLLEGFRQIYLPGRSSLS